MEKELAKANRQLNYFKKQASGAGGAGKGFAGMAGSLGIVAGASYAAGKAFSFMKSSVNETNELTLATAKLSTMTRMDAVTAGEWMLMARSRGVGAKQLNQSFISLSKQMGNAAKGSKSSAEAFKQLGVSQAALKSGNTHLVMQQVAEGLKNVKNGSDRARLASQLFGRGAQGLIGVMSGGKKALNESLAAYKGNAAELAKNEKSAKALAAAKRKLKDALDKVKISIGTALTPVLATLAGALTKIANMSPGMKRFILSLAGLAAAAMGIKKLVDAFKAVKMVFMALRVAMMTNPIGLILTAIAVAAYLIISNWGAVKRFLGVVWGWIKTAFHAVANFVVSAARRGFLGPVGWIITHWGQVVSFFKGLPGTIGRFASAVGRAMWNGIKSGASSIFGFVKGIINGLISGLEGGVNLMIDGVNRAIGLANKLPGVDIGKIGHVSIPRLAQGGIVNGARIAMIGEDGPEAVIPLSRKHRAQGAALYAKAGAAMGMGGNTFVVNNYGSDLDENQLAARWAWQLKTRVA